MLLDVNGVGYEVDCPMSTFLNLPPEGGEVALLTHFIVREDAMLLYGFSTKAERSAFRALIRISGIGPRIALAVLSGMTVDQLSAAVEADDPKMLTRVPGIGKKTAERLVLELKGKLGAAALSALAAAMPSPVKENKADIVSALAALGYSEREALAAVKKLPDNVEVSEGIRLALKNLSS